MNKKVMYELIEVFIAYKIVSLILLLIGIYYLLHSRLSTTGSAIYLPVLPGPSNLIGFSLIFLAGIFLAITPKGKKLP